MWLNSVSLYCLGIPTRVSSWSSLVGGFACDSEDSFYSRVYDAFQKRLAEGDADLSSGLMSELLFVVLDVAGGSEYEGNAISQSGGNSESATRLMYAEDPAATCVNALAILDEYLADKVPQTKCKTKR